MKRLLAFILTVVIAIGALASCTASEKGGSASTDGQSENQLADNSKESGEAIEEESGASAEQESAESDAQKDNEETKETVDVDKLLNGNSANNELQIDPSKKLTFGSYPQTEVTEAELVAALNSKAGALPTVENAQSWTSYGYYASGSVSDFMWYVDIEYGEERYRGVYFTEYRSNVISASVSESNSYQDDNGYTSKKVYWFKYEPLSWIILDKDDETNTALIVCEMIIDAQAYQNEYSEDTSAQKHYNSSSGSPENTYANNYAYSTIRKWLNDTFLKIAFSAEEQAKILESAVDNSAASTGYSTSAYACANTQDKVFLLSMSDVVNEEYAFSESPHENDPLRKKKTSDYAKAQGAYTGANSDNYGNGWWWLRSPRNDNDLNARGVYNDGYVSGNRNVDRTDCGVVPALRVKL